METGSVISIVIYFIAMLGIGLYAYRTSTEDASGYLLGGRKLSPAVTALSAGASDMSGWLVMGLPGAVYLTGLNNIWIGLGLVLGAYINYLVIAGRLRIYTEIANDSITLPDFFENRFADHSHVLRMISSLVIIIFFTLYTSSGVVAGGKLFERAFHLSYESGLYITTGVVVLYTLFGGFLAVSMTDFVQGCIMFIALVLVPLVVLEKIGGADSLIYTINQIDSTKLALTTGTPILAIVSSLAWGLGYFGQPHILVRFMAIRSLRDIKTARRIGMSWMIISLAGAIATGFVGIAYIAKIEASLADTETIFIYLSQILFHPLITGFLLAAVLAAIMSTVSSQLLVTSSSLTEDIYKTFLKKDATQKQLVLIGRISVVIVAAIAISLAQNRENSILQIVSNAWAGFGAAFGPMIILNLYWKRMTTSGALAGMIVGAATVLFWVYAPVAIHGQSLSQTIYEIVPGFVLSTLAIIVVSLKTRPPAENIVTMFDAMKEIIKPEHKPERIGSTTDAQL